jgi:hypothetical protein
MLATLLSAALTWSAPSECEGRQTVEREIARSTRPVSAEVVIEHASERVWHLRLDVDVDGKRSRRDLEAPSCAELVDAAAVMVAIETGMDPERAAQPAPASPPALDPDPDSDRDVSGPARSDGPHFAAGVAGALALGSTATPALGVDVAVAWTPEKTRIAVDGAYFPPASIENATQGIGGRFTLLTFGLTACRSLLSPTTFDIAPCAGVDVGRISARGEGTRVASSSDESRLWFAARAGVLFTYAFGDLAFRADLGATVPIVRDTFVIGGIDQVHRPAVVGGRALAGIDVRF